MDSRLDRLERLLLEVATAQLVPPAAVQSVLQTLHDTYRPLLEEERLTSLDVGNELDFVFRKAWDRILGESSSVESILSGNSSAQRLFQISLDSASSLSDFLSARAFDGLQHFNHLFRIPFILLDDIILAFTVSKIEALWTFIESCVLKLHQTTYFSKGEVTVLKICNTVLKRLSKSRNTEFSGRILMLLSSVYSLTHRSALNMGGEVNVASISTFESEEEFQKNAEINQTSSRFDNASDNRVSAIEPKENEEGEEPDLDFNENRPSYEIYKTFWGLQSYLCAALPKPDPATGIQSIDSETLSNFLVNASLVLNIFDKLKFPAMNEKRTSTFGESYMGTKYLTSSQLLPLQLKDPVLRIQILSQILIHIKFLRVKSFEIKIPSSKPSKDVTSILKRLDEVEALAEGLLSKVPPHGKKIQELVSSLLVRESSWIRWKGIKPTPCPEFVRHPTEAHKNYANVGASSKRTYTDMTSEEYYFDVSEESIRTASLRLTDPPISFGSHIEAFVQAEDPEAGIEEEFHPKHSSVYCWRALRLLAAKDVILLEKVADGDFARGIRTIMGLASDGPAPSSTESVSDLCPEQSME